MHTNLAKKGIIINNILDYKNLGENCQVHSTAIIEESVVIGNNVKIGAYSVIGKDVKIGDNCELKSHVVIEGDTKIGKNNKIHSFVVIGQDHQDLKYAFQNEKIIIGDNNRIKEHVTIHPGTKGGGSVTVIGNNNLLMVGAHVAHDCTVGSHCILANNATLAGHVEVGDFAIIGGLSAVHQFSRVGKHSIVGGMTGVEFDVIPYGTVMGNRARLEGLNLVGLKRRNFSREEIHALRNFYKDVFCGNFAKSLAEGVKKVKDKYSKSKIVGEVIEFLESNSKRGFCVTNKTSCK